MGATVRDMYHHWDDEYDDEDMVDGAWSLGDVGEFVLGLACFGAAIFAMCALAYCYGG